MWTIDQQTAISSRGANLLLAAAAGSGKTTVLVERVLSLLLDGANVDQMLIVTFSRAAASDMKRKLTEKLAATAEDNPSMRPQLERVERASISTLHAFCIEILRAHFEAAHVDPSFRVLDDAECRQLESRALDLTLTWACEHIPERLAILEYGRDGLKNLGAMIAALHRFAQERPDPHAWLTHACETWPTDDPSRWTDVLKSTAHSVIRDCLAQLDYARTLAESPLGPTAYKTALDGDIDMLAAFCALPYDELGEALRTCAWARLSSVTIKGDDPDSETRKALKDQAQALRDGVKKLIAKEAERLPALEPALEDMRLNRETLSVLHELTLEFERRLSALKADREALTFNDLEHAALRALHDEHVAASVRARYTHVFVDEYQDVSDLQEAVITRVARPDALFMVGDVKQSIYRFRQAEPALFIGKYRRYAASDGGRLIVLSQNFRSRESILAFTNRIFERAMSGPDAELEYDDAARLKLGAAFAGDDPPIELHIIGPDEDELAAENNARAALNPAEREGALVAGRIKALLSSTIYDPEQGGPRAVRPRDIAVIARKNAALKACERMLREAGIAAYADVDGGYLKALEVKIVLGLMQLIENRRRDYPLLSTLRSPIVGLTSSDLARIRAAHPDGSFRDAVLDYLPRPGELAGTLRAFEARLARWRQLSRALPLNEFVDLLLRETGFYAYAGGMPGGSARQGNLDLLCAYASQFEAAQTGGLTGFLAYMEEVDQSGGDMGAAHVLGEHDDVVRLMTAHKAKGLEFPIVFALQLNAALGAKQARDELTVHRLLGVGLYYNAPRLNAKRETIARRAIRVQREREALEEEKRILYVMLTRAQQQLILVASEPSPDKAALNWACAARAPMRPGSFLDMIMPALPGPGEQPAVALHWHAGVPVAQQAPADARDKPVTEAEVEAARAALTWRYPYRDEAFLPVKLTVSGLTRTLEGAYEAPPMSRRPRFLTGERATAAERGTLTHNAMGALDLRALSGLTGTALRTVLTAQLEAFYARGVLSAPVDMDPIAAFFERETGRRLTGAHEIYREWPFNLRMTVREALSLDSDADLMVQGVIDCCFIEDGAWVLLDYKTDRLPDELALTERYRAQLTLYRHALTRITGIPVKQSLLCLLGARKEIEV